MYYYVLNNNVNNIKRFYAISDEDEEDNSNSNSKTGTGGIKILYVKMFISLLYVSFFSAPLSLLAGLQIETLHKEITRQPDGEEVWTQSYSMSPNFKGTLEMFVYLFPFVFYWYYWIRVRYLPYWTYSIKFKTFLTIVYFNTCVPISFLLTVLISTPEYRHALFNKEGINYYGDIDYYCLVYIITFMVVLAYGVHVALSTSTKRVGFYLFDTCTINHINNYNEIHNNINVFNAMDHNF